MRQMTLCVAMALLVSVVGTQAAEQEVPSELDALKGKYEQVQAVMDAECARTKAQALDAYTNALSAYRAQLKQSGQLKEYLDIDKELARLSEERTFSPPTVTSPYVKKAAEEHERSIGKATVAHQQKTAHLLGQYLDRLRDLIKTLMNKDRIADAAAVQLEIDRLESTLADTQVKKPEPVKERVVAPQEPALQKASSEPSDSGQLATEPEAAKFDGVVFNNLGTAMRTARMKNKPVFMVIYDEKNPTRSKLGYSLGYFLEYQTTRSIVEDNFIQALVMRSSLGVAKYVPNDDPLENCRVVVLSSKGGVLASEGVYANPDVGLERARGYLEKSKGRRATTR